MRQFLYTLLATIAFAFASVTAPASEPVKDSELVAALDRIVTHHSRRLGIPGGALGVVQNGKVVLRKVAGNRGLSAKQPIDSRTMFQIGSIAKTFTAIIAAQFAQAGKLAFSDPVSRFLPKRCVKGWCDGVTVAHLLSHRSGISANGVGDHIESGATYDAVITRALAAKRVCAPGKCFTYNNAAYELVREILETVDKHPYAQILSRQLLVPLKMIGTGSTYEQLKQSDNFFIPHLFQNNRFVETTHSTAYYNLPASSVLNSNLDDMLKLVATELGDAPDVVSPKTLELLHAAVTEAPDAYAWVEKAPGMLSKYGMGHRILEDAGFKIVFHPGWVKGCKSLVAVVPERRLGFVLLQNSGSQLGFRVLEDFARLLKGAVK